VEGSGPAGLLITIAILLTAIAGGFASAETALVRASRSEAVRMAGEGRRGAAALVWVLDNGGPVVNVAVFLRVLCETAAAVCTALAVETWEQRWWMVLLIATALMAVASFVLAGVSPRTVGRRHPVRVSLLLAPTLRAVTRLLGPLAGLLVRTGNAFTPGRGYPQGPFANEGELRDLVDIASEADVIEADERRMIHSVFEIGETRVREVMVPRTDMVTLDEGTTLEQSLPTFLSSGFSRIPIIGDRGLDDPLGVLYLKDVARRLHSGHEGNESMPVERAMRPPFFVPEMQSVESLLRQMQGQRNVQSHALHEGHQHPQPHTGQTGHVALVVDEYGGTAGMVTMEDLIEEVVGEIADEYDRDQPVVEPLGDRGYRVSARLPVDDLGELFGIDLDDDEVDTVAGLLAKSLGRVPIPGSTATVHGLTLTAEGLVGRRNQVASVLVHTVADDGVDDE
jgi:CBS domain containing-hemolysin-like protein